MSKTVTSGEWTTIVPESHGKKHVYITVGGSDVYLSNDVEPKEAPPYGVLLRDGDQVGASVSDESSILSRGKPITARATNGTATVRATYDSRVEPTVRRTVERPGDSAQREFRTDMVLGGGTIGSGANDTVKEKQFDGTGQEDAEQAPFYLETVTVRVEEPTVGQGSDASALLASEYSVTIYDGPISTGEQIGRYYGTLAGGPLKFDPAVSIPLNGSVDVRFTNRTASSVTAQTTINYRYSYGDT